MGTRTEACQSFQVTYNTWVTANGQTTLTGQVQFNAMRSGEAFFDTTATAVGAIGWCATTWDVIFTNAGYPPSSPPVTTSLTETRCDNAAGSAGTGFPARVGCVVCWFASAALYSRSSYPSLPSHVSRAQRSGLPGASFAVPLTRTTNQTTISTNRNRACGNPPRAVTSTRWQPPTRGWQLGAPCEP